MRIKSSSQKASGRDQVRPADLLDSDFDNNRRILVIDDNRAIHEDFRKILEKKRSGASETDDHELALFGTVDTPTRTGGFELDSAYQGEEGLKQVQAALRENRPYAIAFIDVRMPPGWDGLETSARLLKEDPNLQIVICTAYSDYSWDEMIEKIGETDRLLILKKPFDTVEVRQLAHSLHRKWVLSRQVSCKLEALEEKLYYQAYFDPLTALPNRALSSDRLSQAIKHGKRHHRITAVLFIDLDHFKKVNDTFGHTAGDAILKTAGERLLTCVRETDTVARTGGDEFQAIITDIYKREEVIPICKRIIKKFSDPFHIDGREVFLGASIGITIAPDDGVTIDALLNHADIAMYQAKEKGRNTFFFFSKELEQMAKDRVILEWDLKRALENQELTLYYQPVIDLSSLKTVSLEALIRWNHPHHGFVPPDQFIPLAENSDLISQISEWVLLTACTQMKQWQARYDLDTTIAVNVSGRDFQQGQLLSYLTMALEKSGLPAHSLIIEITESLMLDPDGEAIKKLQDIRDVGTKIALDDFGTGYSSLSYLSRTPIDILKIDKSFINNITSDQRKKPLVEAIVRMGQAMGMIIIAEGVETQEDLSYLIKLDCNQAQGYYFSKPLPVKEYSGVLEKLKTNV